MQRSPYLRIAGHAIRRAHQAHDAIFASETAGFDVTSPQHAALTAIAQHPGIEAKMLADLIGYDGATIAGLIARLEAKRLIRRTVGRDDRRRRQLALTPKGAALLKEVTPRADRVHDRLLQPLTLQERRTFMEMLERVVLHAATERSIDETEIA